LLGSCALRWLLAFGVLVLALLVLGPFEGRAQTGDTWRGVDRIVAVGDVHGDHERFVQLLRAAAVVNRDSAWIGGRTHLVQVGDVLDRGPDSRKAVDLLRSLAPQAERAGGRVHALIGNHEAMVLLGDLRYVHLGEYKAFGGKTGLRRAFGARGEYGSWIRHNDAVIRINDVLFVHGGISPGYARQSIAQINGKVRAELVAGQPAEGTVAMDPNGPLWYRGYATRVESELQKQLAQVLANFGVRHVVVGHTVSKTGIQTRLGGRIIMIDVGFSRTYVGAPPACLLIEQGKFFIVTPTARRRLPVAADAVTSP